jgi:hypothetical protein
VDLNSFVEQRAFSFSSVSSGFLLDIFVHKCHGVPVQARRETRSIKIVNLKETDNVHTPYLFEVWANVEGSCFQFLLEYISLQETRMGEQREFLAPCQN